MGQVVGLNGRCKRCNIRKLIGTGAGDLGNTVLGAGEYMLVSSNNTMQADGQGDFDSFVVGDGSTACKNLTIHKYYERDVDFTPTNGSDKLVSSGGVARQLEQIRENLNAFVTIDEVAVDINNAISDIHPITIEGDVENAPDEEDLTSVEKDGTSVLQLKNKDNNPMLYSGLGRRFLRKNIVEGRNVLTQEVVSFSNTIYHIQYDYDLNGQTITLPVGSTLLFEGGSISNGTLVGQSTRIYAEKGHQIFGDDLLINGSWEVENAYSSWFACAKDGYEIDYVNINSTNIVKNSTTKRQTTTTTYQIMGMKKWPTPKDSNSAGDGTVTNPYTIAQALASGSGEFYMKFYPLGICNGETLDSTTFISCTDGILDMVDTHIVIVDSYNGTKYVLNLNNDFVQAGINLKDNYAYSAQPMVARVSKTSNTYGVSAFNCTSLGYYEKYLNNTKVIGEEISDSSISANSNTTTSESRYKVVGDDAFYLAQSLPSASYTSDTLPLQQLLNLRATHTTIEEGVYMIDTSGSRNIGLLVTEVENKRLTIDGTLKAIPTSTNRGYRILGIEGAVNYHVDGKGKIQGDMPEHNGNVENGMCIAISSCYSLVVEGISLEYPMCDCAYVHWRTGGTTVNQNNQSNHLWKDVTFLCGRRTGLVYERGDDITVDRCHFQYNGRYRGIATYAAIDIEPFGSWDSTKRFVENYKFTGNEFYGNRQGLRIERCANVIISGNKFKGTLTSSIIVMENKLTNQSVDKNVWMAEYQLNSCEICNNYMYGGDNAISFESTSKPATAYIHDNIAVSFNVSFIRYINIESSKIDRNTIYDSALIAFGSSGVTCHLTDVDITDNNIFGSRGNYGTGSVLGSLRNTVFSRAKIVNNRVLPLSSEIYNGMREYGFGNIAEVVSPYIIGFQTHPTSDTELIIKDNIIKDEYLWYNVNNPYINTSLGLLNGIRTVNEDNGLFLAGDIIDSQYGQRGLVTKSGAIAGKYGKTFEAGMMLYNSQVITDGNSYDIIYKGGKAGDSWANRHANGTSAFKSQSFADPEIKWFTTGQCTSETRPTVLNTKGRRLVETDTGLLIEFNGTRFVVVNNGYRGSTAERPLLTEYDAGVEYFDTTINQQMRWNGTSWVSTSSVPSGNITDIPDGATGDMFYLTPDNKPIWNANGVWKFADGADVPTNIIFADTTTLKPLIVAMADTNGDGEVSYAEAKRVTGVYLRNQPITSFDEFQYFTGVTEVAAGSFSGCNSITSITFPPSITKINGSAMYTTGATYTVTLLSTTPPSGGYPFNGGNKPTRIYVPDESVDLYKSTSPWNAYAGIIKPLSEKP